MVFEDPEPWPEAVDGYELLDEIVNQIKRYIVVAEGAAEAIALWIVLTYSHDVFNISPILCLTSPEKRCGKTTLLALLSRLVKRPLPAANITPAALFRAVEKYSPSLLIDEADSFLKNSDELRGILNSGHLKSQAFIIRTVGDDFEPRLFKTWGPKAIALIGRLPPTLTDRSIIIPMQRKTKAENAERLRIDKIDEKFKNLRRRLARWASDSEPLLKNSDPEMPGILNDRDVDNWRPLFSIAGLIQDREMEWLKRAEKAAFTLSCEEEDTIRIQLLEDIKRFFEEGEVEKVTSRLLADYLAEMEERPWPEWKHGKPITPRQIAGLLKPFGIGPSNMRISGKVERGYALKDFYIIFQRYCAIRYTATENTNCLNNKELGSDMALQQVLHVADRSATCNTSATKDDIDNSIYDKKIDDFPEKCSVVADKKGDGENITFKQTKEEKIKIADELKDFLDDEAIPVSEKEKYIQQFKNIVNEIAALESLEGK